MERIRHSLRVASWFAMLVLALVIGFAHGNAARAADDWNKVVKAAEGEGLVTVHGPPGKGYRTILVDGFRKSYPKIRVEFTGVSGRVSAPRVAREVKAGIYNWDVYIAGSPNTIQMLLPIKALAPLRPILRPEIMDDSKWFNGFEYGWMDKEKKYIYAYDASVNVPMYVNWDFVSHDDLKTPLDLIKPKFANKIVWDEPRADGSGSNSANFLYLNYGEKFLRKLFREQKMVYTANRRQVVEWLVRGRYPIAFGAGLNYIARYQKEGIGKNVTGFPKTSPKVTLLSAGFGSVSLMSHAPHPNAARVYINWLLSRAGQMEWRKAARNSARTDVPPAVPALVPTKDGIYNHAMRESNLWSRDYAKKIAQETIGEPMAKRKRGKK